MLSILLSELDINFVNLQAKQILIHWLLKSEFRFIPLTIKKFSINERNSMLIFVCLGFSESHTDSFD